jgi:hypothetical protein
MDPVEIVRRVDLLKAARSTIEVIWNDVERYIMPLRLGDMYLRPVAETAIRLVRDDVYDSTAIFAAQRMANEMHGTITNPAVKWRARKFRTPALNDDKAASQWLTDADSREWDELYDSNFDAELSSAYQDLVGPGNAFMSVEAENDSPTDWQGFNFTSIPLKESFFERDRRGDLYRFYRWMYWRATEIKSKWPDIKLPERVEKELGEGGNPDFRFEVIYAVYIREDKRKNGRSARAHRAPGGVQVRPQGHQGAARAGGRLLRDAGVPLPVGEDLGLGLGPRPRHVDGPDRQVRQLLAGAGGHGRPQDDRPLVDDHRARSHRRPRPSAGRADHRAL